MASTEKVEIGKIKEIPKTLRIFVKGVPQDWTIQKVKETLKENEKAAIRAMKLIYQYQTQEEQNAESTHESNGIGFNAIDAEILSSFTHQLESRGFLSPKQRKIVLKRMPKYAKQIYMTMIPKSTHQTSMDLGITA